MGEFEWICWKRKIREENLLSDNVEWSSKWMWKIIPANVIVNVEQQETKELVVTFFTYFFEKDLQSME